MSEYLPIFLAGLAGSMHCVGMCGGFACAMGADPRGRAATLGRHLAYNVGRVTTYGFLGAVVGHLGVLLVGHGGEATTASLAQRALALVSGLLMVFIGLQFFGLFRRLSRHAVGAGSEAIAQALVRGLRTLIAVPGFAPPLAFGVLNGFLPCPLVYAFAAQAAGSGGALPGLLTMAAFGLGTFPAMLIMGGLGGWLPRPAPGVVALPAQIPRAPARALRADWRQAGVRLAGAFIVLLGLITCARGLLPMDAHWHGL